MSMKSPLVSIGIPTYSGKLGQGAHRMENAIQSIKRADSFEPHKAAMVILDDGSPDGGRAVQDLGVKYKIPVIVHPENKGISAAWNSLAMYYKAPITIILNDDVAVTPGWLDAMVFFLKNNPNAGAASWPTYFTVKDDVPKLLNGENVIPRDPISKEEKPEKIGECEDARPGRIMCMAGCGFAFTWDKYMLVKRYNEKNGLTGAFPEQMKSFYEESLFGTVLAMHGYISYGLTWPHIWHIWSATFAESPELKAQERMWNSRLIYNKFFNVPREFYNDSFAYTNPLFCNKIPANEVKWLVGKNNNYEIRGEMEPEIKMEHI